MTPKKDRGQGKGAWSRGAKENPHLKKPTCNLLTMLLVMIEMVEYAVGGL